MELLQSFDQQEIDWEPDRPPPVGVTAEHTGGGLARLIVHFVRGVVDVQAVGVLEVIPTERTNAVVAEELLRIEHALEQTLHAMAAHERHEMPLAHARLLPA